MKNQILAISITMISFACNEAKVAKEENPSDPGSYAIQNKIGGYGDEIDSTNYISVDSMVVFMQNKASYNEIKIRGNVAEVCLKKGCWMNLKAQPKDVKVEFKDYAFFVPLNCAKKEVVAIGNAYWDTTSVEMLKHLAEDAKKPQQEIDLITKPELELIFEARGVLFQ
ncbi:MAG: DUF4920 domain-containing protein [Bacteroidetes bacterium]|nr:DUF4920 domain-containing protein [Bacteroidota bacterium]